MTQSQIRSFLTVVEEQSFAKAANALYISQPAVSKSISKLEEELGFPLLERIGGAPKPTRAGKLLYDFFSEAEDRFEALTKQIRAGLKEPGGTVRLGCPETWNPAFFYDKVFTGLSAAFPGVNPEIECCRLPDLLTRLQSGKLDMVITHEFYPPVQYGLSVRHLTDTGCGILYSKSYFSGIRSLADLRGVDFLTFDSDIEKKFGSVIRQVCSAYGFTPTLRDCGQFSAALFRMSCGKGVMYFTDWDNAVNNSSYTYLPLAHKSPVNLIFPANPADRKIPLIAEELTRLFREN